MSWMYDSFHLEGLTVIMLITSLNLLSHHCFQENIGTMTWSVRDLQGSFRESTKSQISLTRFYIHRKLCKELTPWQYLEELSLKSAMFVFVFVFCLFLFCLCLFLVFVFVFLKELAYWQYLEELSLKSAGAASALVPLFLWPKSNCQLTKRAGGSFYLETRYEKTKTIIIARHQDVSSVQYPYIMKSRKIGGN